MAENIELPTAAEVKRIAQQNQPPIQPVPPWIASKIMEAASAGKTSVLIGVGRQTLGPEWVEALNSLRALGYGTKPFYNQDEENQIRISWD